MSFPAGTLWSAVLDAEQRALASGALKPVPTRYEVIEDGNIRFSVRVLDALSRKDEARKAQKAASTEGRQINPFLPPEPELVVADVTKTHLALLNKFNVVPHHLLIVTKEFEAQEALLSLPDFEALLLCMADYESLGFYNGGKEGGASQPHKHLQLVPLPLDNGGLPVPVAARLPESQPGTITTVPGFAFSHAFVRLNRSAGSLNAAGFFDHYAALLASLGMAPPSRAGGVRQSEPYCFLVTRDWMLLVPRSREHFEDISFNSLAFAGSLFVRNEQQLARLKTVGPLHAFSQVTR